MMRNSLTFDSKEKILKKIESIDLDIKNLEESSRSEYVNEGIVNQVRIRIEELKNEKIRLKNMLKIETQVQLFSTDNSTNDFGV